MLTTLASLGEEVSLAILGSYIALLQRLCVCALKSLCAVPEEHCVAEARNP